MGFLENLKKEFQKIASIPEEELALFEKIFQWKILRKVNSLSSQGTIGRILASWKRVSCPSSTQLFLEKNLTRPSRLNMIFFKLFKITTNFFHIVFDFTLIFHVDSALHDFF